YVNDEDVRSLQRDATPLRENDVVTIVPSIAGGTLALDRSEAVELSNDEVARYSRHLIMPEVGTEGQKKLKAASVLLIGTGGLGAPLGLYLAAAGVGRLGKPNVYGSIFRFEGQATVFWAEKGPCYRCLYPEPPPPGLVPSCAEGGVLGVLPGIVGAIQANEAIKLILGKGDPLIGRLLLFDAWKMRFRELKLRKDPACPICGENATIKELID